MSALVGSIVTYGIAIVSAISGWIAFLYEYYSSTDVKEMEEKRQETYNYVC